MWKISYFFDKQHRTPNFYALCHSTISTFQYLGHTGANNDNTGTTRVLKGAVHPLQFMKLSKLMMQ